MLRRMMLVSLLLPLLLPLPAQANATVERLLASGPWCSASSGGTRVVFNKNGTYTAADRGSKNATQGKWKVRGGALYMGEKGMAMNAVPFEVRKGTKGRFTVVIEGERYNRCK